LWVNAENGEAKQKPHRRSAVGFTRSLVSESEPDCRAAKQQRVRKQQIQIQIQVHGEKLAAAIAPGQTQKKRTATPADYFGRYFGQPWYL